MRLAPLLAAAALCVALTGCAAPAPLPVPTTPSWTPDAIVEREFDGTSCEIRMRVVAASDSPDAETAEQLADAKAFLAAGDWSTVEVSLDDYPADELEKSRDQGRTDASLLIGLVSDRMLDDMRAAGHTGPGLSNEGFVSCEPAG